MQLCRIVSRMRLRNQGLKLVKPLVEPLRRVALYPSFIDDHHFTRRLDPEQGQKRTKLVRENGAEGQQYGFKEFSLYVRSLSRGCGGLAKNAEHPTCINMSDATGN